MPITGVGKVKKAINNLVIEKNNDVKAIFFAGLSNIQIGTPVDTGRARSNWFLTDDAPSRQSTASESGNDLSISDFPFWILDEDLFYTNNLPYIEALEYESHSKQAPNGWVRSEILKIRQAIRNEM